MRACAFWLRAAIVRLWTISWTDLPRVPLVFQSLRTLFGLTVIFGPLLLIDPGVIFGPKLFNDPSAILIPVLLVDPPVIFD